MENGFLWSMNSGSDDFTWSRGSSRAHLDDIFSTDHDFRKTCNRVEATRIFEVEEF